MKVCNLISHFFTSVCQTFHFKLHFRKLNILDENFKRFGYFNECYCYKINKYKNKIWNSRETFWLVYMTKSHNARKTYNFLLLFWAFSIWKTFMYSNVIRINVAWVGETIRSGQNICIFSTPCVEFTLWVLNGTLNNSLMSLHQRT